MQARKKNNYRYDFLKSLKEEPKYPYLNYFRVERYITRPLASLVVRAIINTVVTPNQLTWLSVFIGITAGICLGIGKPATFIAGGLLAWLSSIFDCSDGMLARARNTCSDYGAYLDLFLDRFTDLFLLVGLAVGYFRFSQDFLFFLISLLGIIFYFLQVSLYYLTKIYNSNMKFGEFAEARGVYIFLIFAFSLFNQMKLLIFILLIATVGYNTFKIISLIRLGKKRKSTGS